MPSSMYYVRKNRAEEQNMLIVLTALTRMVLVAILVAFALGAYALWRTR